MKKYVFLVGMLGVFFHVKTAYAAANSSGSCSATDKCSVVRYQEGWCRGYECLPRNDRPLVFSCGDVPLSMTTNCGRDGRRSCAIVSFRMVRSGATCELENEGTPFQFAYCRPCAKEAPIDEIFSPVPIPL